MPLPPPESEEEPAEENKDDPQLQFSVVECLMHTFHCLAHKQPDFLAGEASAERLKDFRIRYAYCSVCIILFFSFSLFKRYTSILCKVLPLSQGLYVSSLKIHQKCLKLNVSVKGHQNQTCQVPLSDVGMYISVSCLLLKDLIVYCIS